MEFNEEQKVEEQKVEEQKTEGQKPKKVIKTVLYVVLVLIIAVAGGTLKGLYSKGFFTKAQTQTFTKADYSITLTTDFSDTTDTTSVSGYAGCFQSDDVMVLVIKEDKDMFSQAGADINDITLADYAGLVHDSTASQNENPTAIETKNGFTTFNYTMTDIDGTTATCVTIMLKGTDAYWTFGFVCKTIGLSKYENKFFDWAKTITVQ